MKTTPFLKKPFGTSTYPWNNCHQGTTRAYCAVCGTNHEVNDDSKSLTIDNFLGYQMVEQCCGRLLDVIYEESGEEFAIRFLKEFCRNPLDPRFAVFRITMDDALAFIDKKLREAKDQTEENQKTLRHLEESKH